MKKGEAFINLSYSYNNEPFFHPGESAEVKTSTGKHLTLKMGKERDKGVLFSMGRISKLVVVDQDTYEKTAEAVPLNKQTKVIGYELADWENQVAVAEKLEQMVPKEQKDFFKSGRRAIK
ncbi:hypothetical protein QKW52_12785 [Bacillus sonorensis]|nr:hypothetical protein [Bacillus sonorensis]